MNLTTSTNRKFKRMFVNILSIVVILALAFPATGSVSAQEPTFPEGFHDGMEGTVNAAGCTTFGWTVDPDDRDRDLQIQILSDGSLVATTTADLLREDVGACTGGTCGFDVNLWGLISAGEEHQITAQAYDVETNTWMDLSSTPKSLTCWGYPEGFHDGMEGETDDLNSCSAFGWASDPDDRDRNLDVQILADGEIVAVTSAGQIREDVEVCPDRSCGFNVSLWGLISPYEEHQIKAQAYDEETNAWYDLGATEKSLTCNVPPSPAPWFTVFPEQGVVEGWDWPLGAKLLLKINGDVYSTTEASIITPWDPESNATWAWIDFSEAYTAQPGDVVTVSLFGSGKMEQTHIVQNLSVSMVDQADDTVKGIADPGAEIHVWPYTGQEQLAIAKTKGNAAGKWNADLGGVYDLTPGECGRSEIYDEAGNRTAVDWCVPSTRFTVWPEWNYLEGYEWPVRDEVFISVAGKEDACSLEITPAFPEWDPWNTFFSVNFSDDCTLEAGDLITLSSETFNFTHQIQDLAITNVNLEYNTVTGTAVFDPEQYILHTWVHDADGSYMQMSADGGTWIADFGSLGFDLQPGMGGRVELVDQSSNATAVEWYIPNTRFTVFPLWEWYDAMDWPTGTTVAVTVEGKPECSFQRVSPGNFFNGGFPAGCDIAAGDTITFMDGETSRTHVVRDLAVTAIDLDQDTISGRADSGTTVYIWPHDGWFDPLQAVANDSDFWQVDLGDAGYNIQQGTSGRSEIRDGMGNATAVDWSLNARVIVHTQDDWFRAEGFLPNTPLNFSIYGAPGGNLLLESTTATTDSGGTVTHWVGDLINIMPGNYVIVSDGSSTREVLLEALTFDLFDTSVGTLRGTAPQPFGRTVSFGIGCWQRDDITGDLTTDGQGAWVVELGAPVPNDFGCVFAWVYEADGDISEARPAEIIWLVE